MIRSMEDDAPYELYRRTWEEKKDNEEITPALVLERAKEILNDFNHSGNYLYEALAGNRGQEAHNLAIKLKMDVKQFIKKYEIVFASLIQLMKKDAPYELKERVNARIRSCEELNPRFVMSQAKEMISEFSKKGTESYEDVSGLNGEEAQNMANELKLSLEIFIKKYDCCVKTAPLSGLSPEETSNLTTGNDTEQGSRGEKSASEQLTLYPI